MLKSSAIALVCSTAGLLLAGCGASHDTALRQQSGWGQGVYSVNCARCHDAGRSAGELTGTRLVASFSDAATLQRFVLRAMPYDRRGILTAADSWAVTAWLLDRTGLLQLRHDYLLGPKTAPTQRLGGDVPQTGRTAP